MAKVFGRFSAKNPKLAKWVIDYLYPRVKKKAAQVNFYASESKYAKERAKSYRERIERGETVYLVGLGPGTHNAGVALIETSKEHGIRLLNNHEEERFSGEKHAMKYPELTVEVLKLQMKDLGITLEDIHAFLATFDYVNITGLSWVFEEAPATFKSFFKKVPQPDQEQTNIRDILFETTKNLGNQMGVSEPFPIIGMRHHDNHASFSYAVSPFSKTDEKVMVVVIDGYGDDSSISSYIAENGQLKQLYTNNSVYDSVGIFYSVLSSTQGGWTPLSSEGRYMGAAAWGNGDRLTNPYYRQLRQLLYFSNDGEVFLNRTLANWQVSERLEPYTEELIEILGEPIQTDQMWNPDHLLSVEDIRHPQLTRNRLDIAAATQMVFEDAMFHIIGHLIRETGCSKLVLTGGTALNCVANMRLLEHFNEEYYERYFGQKDTCLHLWVPPTPGDAGVTIGAAYNFAMQNGVTKSESLRHAFYCGFPPKTPEIHAELSKDEEINFLKLGNINDKEQLHKITDLLAYIIANNGICGLYQGAAETGPRALGHRSILANPTTHETRTLLNELVKFRELVRPLAPMATLEAAMQWFELSPGASDDNYNAYNYMVLTAKARRKAHEVIPAVIHRDGTGRLQIVREEVDPFTFSYLRAMGRRVGVEISVNTSLNVGGPIVQTPEQALKTVKKSKGMHGVFMVAEEGDVFLAYHNLLQESKDGGKKLGQWIHAWQQETGVRLVSLES